MRTLVTGGAGFVGSHAVVELMLRGVDVVILDDLSNSEIAALDGIEAITGHRPDLVVGALSDIDAIESCFAHGPIDDVVHLAALKSVPESVHDPLSYFEVNVAGTVRLLKVCERRGVRRLVFSSSCTVYGDSARSPIPEDAPLAPASPYGRTKVMVESILSDLASSDPRWRIASLRYFNPVGAHPSGMIGERPIGRPQNLFPAVCRVAAGLDESLIVYGTDYPTPDGTPVRDYVHVSDIAIGHVLALDALHDRSGFSAWNLGTGSGTSALEMVRSFQRHTGRDVPFTFGPRRPGDVAAIWADPTKAAVDLGWRAERDVADMCRDAWRFAGRWLGSR